MKFIKIKVNLINICNGKGGGKTTLNENRTQENYAKHSKWEEYRK